MSENSSDSKNSSPRSVRRNSISRFVNSRFIVSNRTVRLDGSRLNQPARSGFQKVGLKHCEPSKIMLETPLSFKNMVQDIRESEPEDPNLETDHLGSTNVLLEPGMIFSARPISELDVAATTIQKIYKSYRVRRDLADCAVVVEELWWKALNFAASERSPV